MKITRRDLDALDSILRPAEEDWLCYFESGYGPKDFPTDQGWRQHVRRVNADFRRVKRLINRACHELRSRA